MAKAEMRDRDMTEEAREEAKEASNDGARDTEEPAGERKRGGKVKAKRKSGGMVPGMKPMERPDRRARGGGTSDTNPLTSAGNVSSPSYLTKGGSNGGGAGPDKNSYGSGSHRRPG